MTIKEIGFSKKFEAAVALIESLQSIVVNDAESHAVAKQKLATARDYRTSLDAEYKVHPSVVDAKRIQALKIDLDGRLEKFVKDLKNGVMLAWENEEEEKRLAKQRELQKKAEAAAKAENDRIMAEQKKEFDRLEKLRKAAEKKGDDEAAAKLAADAAEVKATAQEMKDNPFVAAAVVLDKVPTGVPRRMVAKWRIRTADGKVYAKGDFSKTLRVKPADVPGVASHYFVLDPTVVSGVIDSLGKNHGIPCVEFYEEPA